MIEGDNNNDTPKENEALYIKNINEKIKSDELKKSLYLLFSQYGEILEVNVKKRYSMKGQAFVVFRNKHQSSEAMRRLQNFVFFGKEIKIQYALNKSDIIAKKEGVFNPSILKKRWAKKHPEPEHRKPDPPTQAIDSSNNILVVSNLSSEVTTDMLDTLFKQYPGCLKVEALPQNKLAFVEFEEVDQARVALFGLNHFFVTPEIALEVSFAKQ